MSRFSTPLRLSVGTVVSLLSVCIVPLLAQTPGNITFERWTGIPGSSVDALKINGISKRSADISEFLSGAATAQLLGNNYGARLRGTVTAPITGNYTFFISSDDHGELYLSETASGMDKELIAWHRSWSGHNDWSRHTTQRSRTISLQAGQQYYIEALMKEAGGSDHLSIGWSYEAPASFQQVDLGSPVTAAWTENNGVYSASVISGDIGGTSDHGSINLRPWTGDGEFTARISSMNNPNPWAKAGLTIRDGLGADARHATILLSGTKGMAFQRRTTTGGGTSSSGHPNDLEWVRLVRKGDKVDSYISADGIVWKWLGSATLAGLSANIQVGFSASNMSAMTPVEASFRDFSASPLTAAEVIPASQLTSFASDPLDADNDNLPDAWQIKFPIIGTAFDQSEFGDPDGDLLTNLEESQLDTNPNSPNGKLGHWLRESWNETGGYDVADLVQNDAFFGIPDAISLAAGPVVQNDRNDGVRQRAVLTAPVTGDYTFWISGIGGGELWLSTDQSKYAKRRIAVLGAEAGTGLGVAFGSAIPWDTFASQMSEPVYLVAGQRYFIEVLSQNGHTPGDISLAWARPGQQREYLDTSHIASYAREAADADDDYLPDTWEQSFGLSATDNGLTDRTREGENGDYDGDGLNNRLEYLAGTNPANADTDGDGLNDGDELNSHGTDPLTSDAPAETVASTLDLETFTSADYNWSLIGGGLLSDTFRGAITWNFAAPTSGTWVIQVDTRLRGTLRANETVHVNASIDGQFVGRYALKYGATHHAILRIISPSLSAGSHTLTLEIDNLLGRRMVQIEAITLRQPIGIDTDGDGIPDWIENQLSSTDFVSGHATTSRTSPFCLEGRARLRPELLLNGQPVLAGGDSTHWYANLPLSATASTPYTAAFANGQTATGSVDWQVTNVLDNETLTIRRGDSLKLTARPGGVATGLSATLGIAPVNLTLNPSVIASQSTTAWGSEASRAVDNNTSGVWAEGSVTHTTDSPGSWWQVDLGADFAVNEVVLWNRQNVQQRLSNYRVSVINAAGVTVASKDYHTTGTTHTGDSESWQLAATATGRIIRVELLGANNQGNHILSLAEVQVFSGPQYALASDSDIAVHTFAVPGTRTVTATHADGSTGTLTVNVLQAAMPDDTTVVQNTVSFLTLEDDKTTRSLYFQGGRGLDLGATETIDSDSYKFRLYPRSGGRLGVVARLWKDGPILDVADINAVTITDALQNGLTTAFSSQDFPGYYLVTTPMVVLDLPVGGKVEVTIFRSGVTFPDGTKKKTLYASDFANGLAFLEFLFPVGMEGGFCHYIDIYDGNGTFLGRR